MSEVRFDNCLIEIDNVVYYDLPTKLVDYVKKLYENNKSYQRQVERLGDKLAENTNYWVRTTDERNELQNQLQQKENIINELNDKIEDDKMIIEGNRDCIDNLRKDYNLQKNIIKEVREKVDNFDVFKEFTFPLMKRDEEQQVKSSIDYEWRKSIKEPILEILDKVD